MHGDGNRLFAFWRATSGLGRTLVHSQCVTAVVFDVMYLLSLFGLFAGLFVAASDVVAPVRA